MIEFMQAEADRYILPDGYSLDFAYHTNHKGKKNLFMNIRYKGLIRAMRIIECDGDIRIGLERNVVGWQKG